MLISGYFRNKPFIVTCKCGDVGKYFHGNNILCDKCSKNDNIDEDELLIIVDSPRTGVCGYE